MFPDLPIIIAAPFIGSFLGVVIKRTLEGRSIVVDRSRCDNCQHKLGVRDLMPIASWLVQAGRCRYCGHNIGVFYLAVELAAVIVAFWSVAVLPGWLAWATAAMGWLLLVIAWIDQYSLLLPDPLVILLGGGGLVVTGMVDHELLIDHVLGALAGFVLFSTLAWLYRLLRGRDGLGKGDAKLLASLGAWVAWEGLFAVILYGAMSGLLYCLVRGGPYRKPSLEQRLPFGPHLCLGGWLVWLYGPLVPGLDAIGYRGAAQLWTGM